MSTALEVGKKLVDLCRNNKSLEAVNTLYSPDIVSVEAQSPPGKPREMKGIQAIRDKHDWWYKNHEIHSGIVTGPWPHDDRFIVGFKYDVTPTSGPMAGKRMTIDEAALYTTKDGKIVREEFFYHMGA
jgi:hypothetical protein